MRLLKFCALLGFLLSLPALGTPVSEAKRESSPRPDYNIVERGANHRVWQATTAVTNASGKILLRTNSYTELSTGLHYLDAGSWIETEELIELHPNGAVAHKGQHKVAFANNINTEGAVDLTTPDGKRFRSWILGLSYFDNASGKSVLIAELKDSIGELVSSNQVIYPNAFTDFKADVRYIYTRAGLEQDVILREQIPSPLDYGLDPVTTRLQVLTEFFEPPVPQKKETVIKDGVTVDDIIHFGAMRIGRGKAFMSADRKENLDVEKTWLKSEGRDFLIEAVPLQRIDEFLKTLPLPASAALRTTNAIRQVAAKERDLPKRKVASIKHEGRIQVASLKSETFLGFVIDYPITLVTATNFTFKGDATYYASSSILLSGTTTIEGGAVIKATNNGVMIEFAGSVDCQTEPYRPAIFTAKDDNSVGAPISGSTGTPSGRYWFVPLWIDQGSQDLKHLRISHAEIGVAFLYAHTNTLSHSQLTYCDHAIYGVGSSVGVKNVLISDSAVAVGAEEIFTVSAEHLTVNRVNYLAVDYHLNNSTLKLTNSLLVSVTNLGTFSSIVTNCVQSSMDPATVFQTVESGGHYLATSSPYRNAGTANISPDLLTSLADRTTFPPTILASGTNTTPLTLSRTSIRDDDGLPDIGYHYDSLDYLMGATKYVADVTLTNGVAVGLLPTAYIYIQGGTLKSEGRPNRMNRLVTVATVQEQPVNAPSYNWLYMTSGNLYCRFTEILPSLRGHSDSFLEGFGEVIFRDSRLSWLALEIINPSGVADRGHFELTNNIVENSLLYLGTAHVCSPPSYEVFGVSLQNNLFRNSELWLANYYLYQGNADGFFVPWFVRNNLFDSGSIQTAVDADMPPTAWLTLSHNAFGNGASNGSGGTSNRMALQIDYETGPLGNFYYPSSGATNSLASLIDAGSTNAHLLGLYHFTTTTNQIKETNTFVDIGFHYVAVNGQGLPFDTDDDGVPDWFEDSNGDGDVDSGETDWKNAFDLGLRVWITKPKSNSNLP